MLYRGAVQVIIQRRLGGWGVHLGNVGSIASPHSTARSSASSDRRQRRCAPSEELYLDREQIERDAWLDTLQFPPFLTRVLHD
jgi:hypothetical protein